jgi:hypothetical protein
MSPRRQVSAQAEQPAFDQDRVLGTGDHRWRPSKANLCNQWHGPAIALWERNAVGHGWRITDRRIRGSRLFKPTG